MFFVAPPAPAPPPPPPLCESDDMFLCIMHADIQTLESRYVSQDLEAHFKAKGKAVTHETIEEFAWETLNSGKVRTFCYL